MYSSSLVPTEPSSLSPRLTPSPRVNPSPLPSKKSKEKENNIIPYHLLSHHQYRFRLSNLQTHPTNPNHLTPGRPTEPPNPNR